MENNKRKVSKADGKLAVLIPGLGAVATTLMAGVELARQGKGKPIGSLTQLGTARLGKRSEGKSVLLKELVPLADLNDIAFGAWDIISEDAAQVADRSGVLSRDHIDAVTRPVRPSGHRRSARIQRSTPGLRSFASACVTVGSSPSAPAM